MNSLNAVLFIALGSVMQTLPHLMPAWFPRQGPDQASASALWMISMGFVQVLIGVLHLVRSFALPLVSRLALALPQAGEPAMPVSVQHAAGR